MGDKKGEISPHHPYIVFGSINLTSIEKALEGT